MSNTLLPSNYNASYFLIRRRGCKENDTSIPSSTFSTRIPPEKDALVPPQTIHRSEKSENITNANVAMHQTGSFQGLLFNIYPQMNAKTGRVGMQSRRHPSSSRPQHRASTNDFDDASGNCKQVVGRRPSKGVLAGWRKWRLTSQWDAWWSKRILK